MILLVDHSQEDLKLLCHKVTLHPVTVPPIRAFTLLLPPVFQLMVKPTSQCHLRRSCGWSGSSHPVSVPSFTTAHGSPPPSLLVALSSTRKVLFQVSQWRLLVIGSLPSDSCSCSRVALFVISCKIRPAPCPHTQHIPTYLLMAQYGTPHYYFLQCTPHNPN